VRRLRAIALSLLATVGLAASATPASAAPPNSWTATGPLATTRLGGVGAALPGDRALVTGGQNSGGTTLMSTEIYSATTNSWSSAPDMGTGRVVATATELPNGKVLVAGGMTTTSASSALDTGEVYDPVANTWTPVANTMSTKRGRHVAVLLPNGTVVIAGVGGIGAGVNFTVALV